MSSEISPIQVYGETTWKHYLDDCITGIIETDSVVTEYPESYRKALEKAVLEGMRKRPLNAEWIRDKVSPEQAEKLLKILREVLPKHFNDLSTAEAMGTLLYRIETFSALKEHSHKIAHLFLNYLGAFCGLPLLRFQKGEAERYWDAVQSPLHTQALISDKMREAIIVEEKLWERVVHTPLTDCYKNDENEKLTIQWNELVKATKKWVLTDESHSDL